MDRERDYYAERRDRDNQPRPHAAGHLGANRCAPADHSARTLEVWKEGHLLEKLDLTARRRYAVGRAEGSDVWTEHESCSRRHAELRVEADGVFLVDLDSAGGTCIGAARLPPHGPPLRIEPRIEPRGAAVVVLPAPARSGRSWPVTLGHARRQRRLTSAPRRAQSRAASTTSPR